MTYLFLFFLGLSIGWASAKFHHPGFDPAEPFFVFTLTALVFIFFSIISSIGV